MVIQGDGGVVQIDEGYQSRRGGRFSVTVGDNDSRGSCERGGRSGGVLVEFSVFYSTLNVLLELRDKRDCLGGYHGLQKKKRERRV